MAEDRFLGDTAVIDDAVALALPPRPYPGLRPFEAEEWPLFFGRERMVDEVVRRLLDRDPTRRMVVVHGDSGSGKSSLIRAGVLPRLHQEQSFGGTRWRTCTALPGGGPLRQLAQALAALDGRAGDAEHVLALRRALNLGRRAPAALAELMLAGEHDHLCLLIDQFEELFEHARLPGGEPEARGLTDLLVAMAEAPPRGLYVVLTMRSEYLGACARFPGLAEAVNRHQYLLPPMDVDDLLRAIGEPAGLFGGSVEPALAERLAADAQGADGLPLVQHALMLMHRGVLEAGAPADDWRLTTALYPASGLGTLLSDHADRVAAAAQPAGQPRLVEDLMRALTAKNADGHAVRRQPRQTLAQLAAVCAVDTATLRPLLDAMRDDGVSFLTPRRAPGDSTPLADDTGIDIGHEALIRCWRKLAAPADGWLENEFANGLVWRSLLVQVDSYVRDPRNVLSAATTEARAQWLKRRNAAWAERYGGDWDRVFELIRASQQAEEARALAEQTRAVGQAQQEARAQWRERQGRRQLLIAMLVASSAVALAGVAVWQWRAATASGRAEHQANNAAKKALKDAQDATLEAVAARQQAEVDRKQALDGLDALRTQLDGLRQAGRGSGGGALQAIETSVNKLGGELGGGSNASGDVQPRVYLHIGNSGQRLAAEAFAKQLAKGPPALVVPGTQLVSGQRNEGVLRCFRAAECRDEAPQLLALANGLLASPRLALQDLSARYENSGSVRPHHFEIWFGNADVTPAPTKP